MSSLQYIIHIVQAGHFIIIKRYNSLQGSIPEVLDQSLQCIRIANTTLQTC